MCSKHLSFFCVGYMFFSKYFVKRRTPASQPPKRRRMPRRCCSCPSKRVSIQRHSACTSKNDNNTPCFTFIFGYCCFRCFRHVTAVAWIICRNPWSQECKEDTIPFTIIFTPRIKPKKNHQRQAANINSARVKIYSSKEGTYSAAAKNSHRKTIARQQDTSY